MNDIRLKTRYEMRESDGRFYVQHTDENGETWDADPEGFDTAEEAAAFLEEVMEIE